MRRSRLPEPTQDASSSLERALARPRGACSRATQPPGSSGSTRAARYSPARAAIPTDRVELRVARLQDPLPDGPFDVVVSALAVHHLDGAGKAELFQRIADRLTPSGRFVLGDFVALEDPSDLVTPLDAGYDHPSTIADQLRWLTAAGLQARVAWAHRDLAVLVGYTPSDS